MKKFLIFLIILVVLGVALIYVRNMVLPGGGGGGSTKQSTSARSCVSVSVDLCGEYHVQGTVTNTCDRSVDAVVYGSGYRKDGSLMDRDVENVLDVPAHGTKYFEAVLDLKVGDIPATCRAEVDDASY